MGKLVNLTNKKFTRLLVIKRIFPKKLSSKPTYWECLCDCGVVTKATSRSLTTGHTKSCGCYMAEMASQRQKAKSRHRDEKPEYHIWCDIKYRCYNSKTERYKNYGGRGIKMCDEWKESFETFFEDMGPRPSSKYCIERVDNNGNYEPSNCMWELKYKQNRNKTTCKLTEELARYIRNSSKTVKEQERDYWSVQT